MKKSGHFCLEFYSIKRYYEVLSIVKFYISLLFVCSMAYQPLYVIQCQIHFYMNNQFYFKQFSLA